MSDTSSLSANAIIESSTVRADSLRPSNANQGKAKDLPGRIADAIKNFSGSQESYGHVESYNDLAECMRKFVQSFAE